MITSPLPTTPTGRAERRRMPLRRKVAALSTTAVLMLATACGASDGTAPTSTAGGSASSVSASSLKANTVSVADTHADADDGDYSPDGATTITLADGASTADGTGARVEGDVVTITRRAPTWSPAPSPTARSSWTAPATARSCWCWTASTSPRPTPHRVVVTEADEAVVVLADGSTNALADSADYARTTPPTATLFSMADLTIAGSGSLTCHRGEQRRHRRQGRPRHPLRHRRRHRGRRRHPRQGLPGRRGRHGERGVRWRRAEVRQRGRR